MQTWSTPFPTPSRSRRGARVRHVVLVLAFVTAFWTTLRAQAARTATNLVTHSEIVIERPADAIWPHIVDPNSWKRGAKLWHHSGPAGQPGEVFAAGDPARPDEAQFLVENVELVPGQRRTIKLYEAAGRLLGFATWWLRQSGERTTVGYDVYSETLIEAPASADSLRRAEREEHAANQRRFDEELRGLKRLVEESRR